MNTRLMTAVLLALGCGLAASVISCGDDSTVTDAPGNSSRSGRSPGLLAGNCNTTLAVNRCGIGNAGLSYNENAGELLASNLNSKDDGVSSTFDKAHHWEQRIQATLSQDKYLVYTAFEDGAKESEFTIASIDENPDDYTLSPVFYAGSGNYTAEVYERGTVVASQSGLNPTLPSTVIKKPMTWAERMAFLASTRRRQQQRGKGTSFTAGDDTYGACEWAVLSSRGNKIEVILPDGTITSGDEIRFIEEFDEDGRYPYNTVSRIDMRSNIGDYLIQTEYAIR